MKTSVTGYPRVGSGRELKFATEKYFRSEIGAEELHRRAAAIRARQWKTMAEAGVDFIPSNDFSFYDQTLDAAFLFNIIPERYRALDLPALDTYFAMAKGYQGESGDVHALPMKKWFNTNYHYIAPEIGDDTQIRLSEDTPVSAFLEAAEQGIHTRPVLVGAYTLLRLAVYKGEKRAEDFAETLAEAYAALIAELERAGASWVQLDEPFLVHDQSAEDIDLFLRIYEKLLRRRGNVKILLQTCFGDIRDGYERIMQAGFDGIGLDFVEGRQTLSLMKNYGFPENTVLFAGVVNGKNIWRNEYAETVRLLEELEGIAKEIVISTSCSLLHVPYSLGAEHALPESVKAHFAFAEEKLGELAELKLLSGDFASAKQKEAYSKNCALFASPRENTVNREVERRVSRITEKDYRRVPEFAEREKIQKAEFSLPLLPTTTIGSFPQTGDVKEARRALKQGLLPEEEYNRLIRDKIRRCIGIQEEIGLDVLVHGEYERNDMVEYFGGHFDGFLFTQNAWVQSYGTRCVKPPVIWGDVSRKEAVTVPWSSYAQSLTDRPVKGMLTGPVTILNWSFPREDISARESTLQIALAVRDEVMDLERAGIRMIQIDEAALREKLPLRRSDWYREYLDWAIPAFRLCASGVKPETQIHTHMCYSEFTDIIPAIDDMDADVITFEASRSDLRILDALKENHFRTETGPGVYDIHSPRIPSEDEIAGAIHQMLERIPKEKLWVNPDCGLKTRGEEETVPSLQNLVAAAKRVRHELAGEG